MEHLIIISGPLARDLALREAEEFFNKDHGPDGRFSSSGGSQFSPKVKGYLKDQYNLTPEKAQEIGLKQDGSKLLIPFKNEHGKVTDYKWRDTAVLTKEAGRRWGPSNRSLGLSLYENKDKSGPLYVVESPSEGVILAAHNHRVVFFDGADSLVSRTGVVNKKLQSQLMRIVKGNHSILIPDNDVVGQGFANVVQPLVTRRVNPPKTHKDLREYLLSDPNGLEKLIK